MTETPSGRLPLARAALVWVLLCVLLVALNGGNIATRRFPDPDDTLRLVQVRDWLAGQAWFDMHQYRIDPPHGTLMHWSRLVDLPIAAVIAGLTPLLGSSSAELAALVAVPLLTLGVIVLAVARIASRFFDSEATTFACLSLGLAPLLVAQVQPLRIDHHGWQVAAVMVALLGLLPGRPVRGAVVAGVALAFGLTISLESLPIVAGFGAVFGLRWLTARGNRSLPAFMAALSATLAVLFLATRGLADTAVHCDTVSPAHLALAAVVTLPALALAAFRAERPVVVVAVLAAAGVAGLAVFLSLAPQCAAGPFGNLDPLVRHYWYDNVQEGQPVWKWSLALALPVLFAGGAALAVLVHFARVRPAAERRWWLEYLIVAAVAYLAALLTLRSQAFVSALSAVPLGWLTVRLLERVHAAGRPSRRIAAALVATAILIPAVPMAIAGAVSARAAAAGTQAQVVKTSACDFRHTVPRLDALPRGTIFAPLDMGPEILVMSRHAVVATSHHRAAAAMHDVIAAFTSPADRAHALLRQHGAGYLALCTDIAEPRIYAQAAPHGLAADLLAGRTPKWLAPVEIGAPRQFKLWRVVG